MRRAARTRAELRPPPAVPRRGADGRGGAGELPPPMTVERALALPAVQLGDPLVCAGRESLGREIRWAHAAEIPNIARLLDGSETGRDTVDARWNLGEFFLPYPAARLQPS